MKHLTPYHRLSPGKTLNDPGDWKPYQKTKRQKFKELANRIFFETRYLLRLLRKKGFE